MRTLAVLAFFVVAACSKAKPATDTTKAASDSANAAKAAKVDSGKILGRDSVRQGPIIALLPKSLHESYGAPKQKLPKDTKKKKP